MELARPTGRAAAQPPGRLRCHPLRPGDVRPNLTRSGGGGGLASPRSDGPIRGRARIRRAAVLLDPAARPSIRAVAHQAEISHGAVGEAAKLLREAGLIGQTASPRSLTCSMPSPTPRNRRRRAGRLGPDPGRCRQIGGRPRGSGGAGLWPGRRRCRARLGCATFRGRVPSVDLGADRRRCPAGDASPQCELVGQRRGGDRGGADAARLPEPASVPPHDRAGLHAHGASPLPRPPARQDPGRRPEILDGWNPDHAGIHRVW